MEEKLEKAITEQNRLRAEEAEKIRDLSRHKDTEKNDVERELYRSITQIDELKQKQLQKQVASRHDHERDLMALEKRLESCLNTALAVKDEELELIKRNSMAQREQIHDLEREIRASQQQADRMIQEARNRSVEEARRSIEQSPVKSEIVITQSPSIAGKGGHLSNRSKRQIIDKFDSGSGKMDIREAGTVAT